MLTVQLQKYLFEAGLSPLTEMSDKALDNLAPDEGLEVSKKAKIKGLLQPGDWSLKGIEYLEGPHGDAEYETCENCKKSIRYVCTIMGEDEQIVGPDCALTLLPPGSEDAKTVEDFVGKRIAKNKFVKNAIKLFESSISITPEEQKAFDRLKPMYDEGGWKLHKQYGDWPPKLAQFQNLNADAKMFVQLLFEGAKAAAFKKGIHGLSFAPGIEKDATKHIGGYSTKKWLEKILTDPKSLQKLSGAFEQVWKEQVSLRNKKYFFDPKGGPYSSFLHEFKAEFGGTESCFE